MSLHHASCHCGGVSYDVDVELDKLITCNCSMCGRSGAIMAFVPRTQVSNLKGEDQLTDYQFGKKTIHHAFCKTCGIRALGWGGADGQEYVMVNVRCLEDVDVHTLKIAQSYDGKKL